MSSIPLNRLKMAFLRPLKEKALAFMSVKTKKSKSCEEIASSFLEYCKITNDEVKRVKMKQEDKVAMRCSLIKGKAELLPQTSTHITPRWNQF